MVHGLWITFMIDWSSESFVFSQFSLPPVLRRPRSIQPFHHPPPRPAGHSLAAYRLSFSCSLSSRASDTIAPFALRALTHRQTGDLPRLAKPAAWLKARFDIINKTCPQFMRPKYFALVIVTAYKAARKSVVEQCSEFISSGHSFTHDLALAAVQQYGLVKSASIDPAKPVPSLAAGLPHFAAGWARCWGRDVVSFLPVPLPC